MAFGGGLSDASAFACDRASTAGINVAARVILHGHDAVAYRIEGSPVKGIAAFSATHYCATHLFVNAVNRGAFIADPVRYAPAHGGVCAMGVALGKRLDVDPTQLKVVGNRFCLNLNAEVFKRWPQDVPIHVCKADGNWPGIQALAPNKL